MFHRHAHVPIKASTSHSEHVSYGGVIKTCFQTQYYAVSQDLQPQVYKSDLDFGKLNVTSIWIHISKLGPIHIYRQTTHYQLNIIMAGLLGGGGNNNNGGGGGLLGGLLNTVDETTKGLPIVGGITSPLLKTVGGVTDGLPIVCIPFLFCQR
jgi:hypothetical protein